VISYSNVLLSEGFEAAIGQHILWGVLTLGLTLFGPGAISIDWLLERRARSAETRVTQKR
jgi:uncharacterized membrane protein YphA (DoxX/SURF4 family)